MIIFKRVFARNFLSYGDNGIEFLLDQAHSTLITGSNGAGKSTFIDALVYGLYGKSYRGLNLGEMINSVNQRGLYVEVDFITGSINYRIIRGQKPGILEIYKDGVKLDESAELRITQDYIDTHIIGAGYGTFTKVCIMSTTNYTPFTQLSSGDRRTFVETMLSATDFAEMAKLHKNKLSQLRLETEKAENSFNVEKVKYVELCRSRDSIKKIDSDMKDMFLADLSSKEAHANSIKDELLKHSNVLKDMMQPATRQSFLDEIEANMASTSYNIMSHKSDISTLNKSILFFENNHVCPSCDQSITEGHSKQHIEELETKIGQSSAALVQEEIAYQKLDERKAILMAEAEEFNSILMKVRTLGSLYKNEIANIDSIKQKIDSIDASVDTSELEKSIAETAEKLQTLKKTLNELAKKKEVYTVVSDLLKDSGIKSSIIEKFIPVLVLYVNKYLDMLGFNIKFDMNSDFKETLSNRYANDLSFENLSMGERLRVSLAITFAWNQIAKLRGKMDSNLIIMDEMLDSALDSDGSEDLFTLIESIFADKNIMIISHKSSFHERVERHIHAYKVDGFTKYELKD